MEGRPVRAPGVRGAGGAFRAAAGARGQPVLNDPLARLAAPPVFVFGVPRSGTTWVYEALTAHPAVAGVLESHMFTRDGFGGLLSHRGWDEGLQEANRELFGQPTGLRQLVPREQVVESVRELASRWLAEALEPGHRFLVEKTPAHYAVLPRIAEVFPSARLVHVLRDGRDVAVSLRAAGRSWDPASRNISHGPPWSAARSWADAVTATRRGLAEVKNPRLEVRYEKLRADPVAELRGLFDFCAIPVDDTELARIVRQTDFSHHRVTGEGAFRRRGTVGDWRENFSRVDHAVFQLAAGDLLTETGYGPPPGPMLGVAQRLLDRARTRRNQLLGRLPPT